MGSETLLLLFFFFEKKKEFFFEKKKNCFISTFLPINLLLLNDFEPPSLILTPSYFLFRKKMPQFLDLGKDVIGLIVKRCDLTSGRNLGLTSRKVHQIATSDHVWRHRLQTHFRHQLKADKSPREVFKTMWERLCSLGGPQWPGSHVFFYAALNVKSEEMRAIFYRFLKKTEHNLTFDDLMLFILPAAVDTLECILKQVDVSPSVARELIDFATMSGQSKALEILRRRFPGLD